mgnify:CR=1 FL=1
MKNNKSIRVVGGVVVLGALAAIVPYVGADRFAEYGDTTVYLQVSIAPVAWMMALFLAITAAVTGLASALGFAALATGGAVLAFNGLGDALGALNKARLEPTEANMEAARAKMAQLSPEARSLVRELSALTPVFHDLRAAAGEGLFPGVERGLDNMLVLLPQVEDILRRVGDTSGDIFAAGTKSLTTDRWDDFFTFLETEARPTLVQTARTVGDLTHGLAELWMAFQPLNRDAGSWIGEAADSFDRWATGLAQTQGFEDFVGYIRANGPQVAETLGAVSTAVLDIVEATAPLGGPSLKILQTVAETVSLIAESPFGPILMAGAAGMSALIVMCGALGGLAVGVRCRGISDISPA